jgi:sialic acid synthase SpsE
MNKIKVGNSFIGAGEPCFIIAEIGQNHNGDMETAKNLIDVAHEAKIDAVKFCKRDIDTELTRDAYNEPYRGPNSFGNTYGEHREKLELSSEQYRELFDYATERDLIFFASVCGPKAVDLLDDIGSPLFKVASRDLTNTPLLEYIARKGKPIILSTGMSRLTEIEAAIATIIKYHDQLILMQCTSEYPTRFENVNLKGMELLRERFGLPVGFSGHTIGILVPVVAAALGAVAVEKHITLARWMKGTDHAGALEPDGLKRVSRDIRNLEKAFGSKEKFFLESEKKTRMKLARSIVARVAIPEGSIITSEMVIMKSPGTGLSGQQLAEVVGKLARRNLAEDHLISLDDVE